MSAVLEFLRTYWFELAAGLAFVIELVFIFVKRRPKSIDDFKAALDEVLTLVPNYIIECEVPGEGDRKKNFVLRECCSILQKKLSRKLTISELKLVCEVIGEQIELVLSTPKKKENLNEK